MDQRRFASSVLRALSFGGRSALVFGTVFFFFLFGTILMAGDGSAPAVTHLSAAIVDFTVKLLGIPYGGSAFTTVGFWTLVVFAVTFLGALIVSKR